MPYEVIADRTPVLGNRGPRNKKSLAWDSKTVTDVLGYKRGSTIILSKPIKKTRGSGKWRKAVYSVWLPWEEEQINRSSDSTPKGLAYEVQV